MGLSCLSCYIITSIIPEILRHVTANQQPLFGFRFPCFPLWDDVARYVFARAANQFPAPGCRRPARRTSRVAFDMEPRDGVIHLTVTHSELEPGSKRQGHFEGMADCTVQSQDNPGNRETPAHEGMQKSPSTYAPKTREKSWMRTNYFVRKHRSPLRARHCTSPFAALYLREFRKTPLSRHRPVTAQATRGKSERLIPCGASAD